MGNSWSTRFRYLMFVIVVVMALGFVWYARVLAPPLVIAALIAYVLAPVVDFITQRTRLKKRAAVNIVFFLGLALILALPALLVPVFLSELEALVNDIEQIMASLQDMLSRDIKLIGQTISLAQLVPDMAELSSDSLTGITVDAFHLIESTTRNLLWLLVILASTYSFLADWDRLREWIFRFVPASYQPDAQRLYDEIKQVWRGYLRGNLALMTVTGILFTIAWLVIGVPGAFVLGLIAGVLTIIPDLGPAIAAILAVLVALVEGSTYLGISNFWFGLLTLGVYLVLINIKNIWIRPRIFGRSVHMHDGVVFVAIVAAVVIEGVLGALVVIPVLASIGVLGRYIWKRILGEEPFPEPPAES